MSNTKHIVFTPDKATISRARQEAYLTKWPIEAQLEALSEFQMGRFEKIEQMKKDLAEIRRVFPYPATVIQEKEA